MHPPQPLASTHQIHTSRSRKDGVPPETEDDLRVLGCMLIQETGILLELPQSTMATAQVLLHRFYTVSSLYAFTVNDTAIAALYLSSKLCETPVRLKQLLAVYLALLHRNAHLCKTLPKTEDDGPDLLDGFEYLVPSASAAVWWSMKDAICVAEMQILKRLGFNMQVDLPYSHMVNYCKILNLVSHPGTVQQCWSILNDALQTPIYTHHPPQTLACFSILLTTRLRAIPLPERWWSLFDAEWGDMVACCGFVTRLWARWGGGGGGGQGGGDGGKGMTEEQRERWCRSWRLAGSRRAVRAFVEQGVVDEEVGGWVAL